MVSNADLGFLLATLVAVKRKKKQKKKRRWSKEWYKLRHRFTHDHLLNFLSDSKPEDYRNFLRMDQESFDYLLGLVRPDIEKKDTKMREAIPASQRLSITLRYLSSDMDLEDLKFTCTIAHHNGNLLCYHQGIEGKHSVNTEVSYATQQNQARHKLLKDASEISSISPDFKHVSVNLNSQQNLEPTHQFSSKKKRSVHRSVIHKSWKRSKQGNLVQHLHSPPMGSKREVKHYSASNDIPNPLISENADQKRSLFLANLLFMHTEKLPQPLDQSWTETYDV